MTQLPESPSGRERWRAAYDAAQAAGRIRDDDFTTLSGVEVDPVYGPEDEHSDPRMDRIGWPGEFPYTRGLYPTGYRGREWTIRQFAGFGNAAADQRALPDDPGCRRRRAECGVRHAHLDGPRLRRPAEPRRGRALRRGHRLGC